MAQAAGALGVPVRFALAVTITELTGIPSDTAYLRIFSVDIDNRVTIGTSAVPFTDGAAIGTHYETRKGNTEYRRAVDQNIQQGHQIGISAASGTPMVEVTCMRQGR